MRDNKKRRPRPNVWSKLHVDVCSKTVTYVGNDTKPFFVALQDTGLDFLILGERTVRLSEEDLNVVLLLVPGGEHLQTKHCVLHPTPAPSAPVPAPTPAPSAPVPAPTPAPSAPVPAPTPAPSAPTPAPSAPVPAPTPAPSAPVPAPTPAPSAPTPAPSAPVPAPSAPVSTSTETFLREVMRRAIGI
jgi:hypothetical protein